MNKSRFTVDIDRKAIDQMVERKFLRACVRLGAEFTRQISEPKWDYPTGESPRDIVDTGRLRASQQGRLIGRLEYEFVWPVRYSLFVLVGGTIRVPGGGVRVVPGRDWISAGLEAFDFPEAMKRG
jgi:hypothetical protein